MGVDYDVVIIGGGMVGATLAHALGGRLRTAVIEAYPAGAAAQPSYDDRAIALAWGTRNILHALGLWADMAGDAEAILNIHVSDRGHFGFVRLDCADEDVDAFGYVVTARGMGGVLLSGLQHKDGVDLLCPGHLEHFDVSPDSVSLDVRTGDGIRRLRSRLLIAADGGNSGVRDRLGVTVRDEPYGQSAIIANLTSALPHRGVAFERFTDSGPLALLPMTEGRCSLVWTVDAAAVQPTVALHDAAFLEAVQGRFGYRLGRFLKVGRRTSYPLRLMTADEQVRPRVALVGNAAHTIHPVAGQGFNLGIRDVAVLAEVLSDAAARGDDLGSLEVLQRYARWRHRDQRLVAGFTDTLARLFTNPWAPVRVARNLGMLALDRLPGARHVLARNAMGLGGRLPRLARGLPLG